MRFTVLILFVLATKVAANEVVISNKAPDGIEALVTPIKVHAAPQNKGHHGLVEYCYKLHDYVVYRVNLLGFGYQLSESKPANLQCLNSNTEIEAKNKLGLHIGMSKQEIEKLVGNIQINKEQKLIWQSKIMVNGINFDIQTYAELKF